MLSLALRNARIVTPKGVIEGDLGIENGQITHVGQVGPAQQDVDLVGHWLMPGGVDPHAHIEQMSGMGLLNADTFETATRSALMGGTTSVISFAAQRHGESIARRVADYSTRAARGAMTDYAFHLIVSDPHVPDFASELRALIEAGHRSLKLFTTYLIKLDDPDILMVMGKARDHGALTCVHAENDALIGLAKRRLLAEGKRLPKHHAESHPRLAEIEAVERLCHFAEYLGSQVMLFHISTAEAAETVRAAKMRGVPIWAETCPHYLMMTEEILDQPDGGKWMCSPPQRTAQDQAALWAALADGTLDLVSSDHAPFRYDETGKLAAGPGAGFPEIANGMPGLETRLPLMFHAMVTEDRGGPEAFARLTSTAPADVYGLPGKGRIEEGADADLVAWNPERSHLYGADDLNDNVGYNPWVGTQVRGWPERVWLRGTCVVDGGKCLARPGQGQWLERPRPH